MRRYFEFRGVGKVSTKLAKADIKDILQDTMSIFVRKENWESIIKISDSRDNKREQIKCKAVRNFKEKILIKGNIILERKTTKFKVFFF